MNLKGRNRGSRLGTRVILKIFSKLLWKVAKILCYITFVTVGFLIIGYALYGVLDLQRFTDLSIIYFWEALFFLWIGARAFVTMQLNYVSHLKANLETSVVFLCSGLLILITGLLFAS